MTAFVLVTGPRFLPADGFLLKSLDELSAQIGDDLMIVHGQCDPRHPDTRRLIRWGRAEHCGVHPDRLLGADWQAHRWAQSTGGARRDSGALVHAGAAVTRRRPRPPWPIQLAGLLAAMIGAALAVTAITHLIIGGAW